jgi:hypothetical protein
MEYGIWWTLKRRREKRAKATKQRTVYFDEKGELPAIGVKSPGKAEKCPMYEVSAKPRQ